MQKAGLSRSQISRHAGRVAAAIVSVAAACSPASAQATGPVADFYRGKTIVLAVGSGEGGGFDLSARLSAPFLSRYIPGNPAVVVQNMPGASGLRAGEYVYNFAPRDGGVICITQPSIVLHKVLNPTAPFEPQSFTWIGRLGSFVTYGVVWHTAPAQTIAEAKTRNLILGAVGPSGPGAMLPAALNLLAGTHITIVKGYKSAAELGLAMERGELQGSGSSSFEYVNGKGWLDKKLARLLYTIGLKRSRNAPDAPTVVELASDELGKNVMRLGGSASEIGRAILAPPGIPADRAAALRQAFEQMIKDPGFIAESERRSLDVDPLSGEEIRKIVTDDMAMPANVVDAMRSISEPER